MTQKSMGKQKEQKVTVAGKVRKEVFGGIYYERNRLVIELLNDTAFEILDMCQRGFSLDAIEKYLVEEYEADAELIKSNFKTYMDYLLQSKFVSLDGKFFTEKKEKVKIQAIAMKDTSDKMYTLGMPPYVLSAPMKVLIELTHNCNLKCVHCFADADYCKKSSMGHIEGELTTEQWYKVIDNILEAGVFEILLSGGEATMRKDLLDIAGYIQKKGASYCLLSNTTLIDDEMAKKLKETGCEKVESNMDGYNAETYDHFRGVEGSFEATVRGIKACLRQGIPVRCNVMETKMNIFDLKKIVDVAYEIGVREVCVVPLESGGRARVNRHLAFQEEDIEELHGFYQEVSTWFDKKYGQTDMVLLTPNMLDKKSGSRFAKVFDISGIMPTCGAGKIHCTVDPYGEVKLCPSDEAGLKKEANSLLKKDLRTIWKQSEILNWIRGGSFQNCQNCGKNCEFSCPLARIERKEEYTCSYEEK